MGKHFPANKKKQHHIPGNIFPLSNAIPRASRLVV
jgi:hypothetical protein